MGDFFDDIETKNIVCKENEIEIVDVYTLKIVYISIHKDIVLLASTDNMKNWLQKKLDALRFFDSPEMEIIVTSIDITNTDASENVFNISICFSFKSLFGCPEDLLLFLEEMTRLPFFKYAGTYNALYYFETKCLNDKHSDLLVTETNLIFDAFDKLCVLLVCGESNSVYNEFIFASTANQLSNRLITTHMRLICNELIGEIPPTEQRFKKDIPASTERDLLSSGKKKNEARKRVPVNLLKVISSNNVLDMSLVVRPMGYEEQYIKISDKNKLSDGGIFWEFIVNSKQLVRISHNRKIPFYYSMRDVSNDYMLRTIYLGSVYSKKFGIMCGSLGLYGPAVDVDNATKQLFHITA